MIKKWEECLLVSRQPKLLHGNLFILLLFESSAQPTSFLLSLRTGKNVWPAGQYGLPMPKAGCPNNWFDGRRFPDVGSGNLIDRKVYESLHLGGWISKEGKCRQSYF